MVILINEPKNPVCLSWQKMRCGWGCSPHRFI
nr:MAG TPA: putative zinc-ribbon domain protein [Bacteriophage sp.]